jgi:iron(III) transport system substrate-binding protein
MRAAMSPTRREFLRASVAAIAAAGIAAGCKSSAREVVVYTSVDQPFSEPIFKAFEAQSRVSVRAVFDTEETKSTGVLNRLIAEGARPQADVFWSGDPVRPFLLMNRGMVEPYISPNASGIPAGWKAQDGSWTGFAARARVLLVNKSRVAADGMPRSIRALADGRYKAQTAIANPLYGTTTIHVAALFAVWGEDRARAFMKELKDAEVRVASSNGEVKRLVSEGEVAFGLTDTDDANEALKDGAPVEVIYPDQDDLGTLVMPTTAALIKGRPHAEAGQALIDYLLSPEVEAKMAESAAHMPLRAGVEAKGAVRSLGAVRAMQVDYAKVAAEMERIQPWLREWSGL